MKATKRKIKDSFEPFELVIEVKSEEQQKALFSIFDYLDIQSAINKVAEESIDFESILEVLESSPGCPDDFFKSFVDNLEESIKG